MRHSGYSWSGEYGTDEDLHCEHDPERVKDEMEVVEVEIIINPHKVKYVYEHVDG
jgi:hypothetical protein